MGAGTGSTLGGGARADAKADRELGAREREFLSVLRARGYTFYDPIYTLLFMAADFLPSARLSALGVWDVKRSSVLVPTRIRAPAG